MSIYLSCSAWMNKKNWAAALGWISKWAVLLGEIFTQAVSTWMNIHKSFSVWMNNHLGFSAWMNIHTSFSAWMNIHTSCSTWMNNQLSCSAWMNIQPGCFALLNIQVCCYAWLLVQQCDSDVADIKHFIVFMLSRWVPICWNWLSEEADFILVVGPQMSSYAPLHLRPGRRGSLNARSEHPMTDSAWWNFLERLGLYFVKIVCVCACDPTRCFCLGRVWLWSCRFTARSLTADKWEAVLV